MPTLFIDFETAYTATVSLRKMTLRQYLAETRVLGMALAVDGDQPIYYSAGELPAQMEFLGRVATDPQWVVVAHNAAFDLRVWRDLCGLPWPQTAYCSLELACAAFPCQPGGYSLKNLARTLNLGVGEKLEIDLQAATRGGLDERLAAYCCRDTELCRAVFNLAWPRLCDQEREIARMCMDVRELHFEIRPDAVQQAFDDFRTIANTAAKEAVEALGDSDGFGFEESGDVRSVKPQSFKDLLRENLGFSTESISFKKINPEKLRANAEAAKALKAAETANKALSHKRRVKVFTGASRIDVELGYYRAHTGRFSSPQPGCKGINLHNLAKRNKAVAKAIRSIFRFPDGLCAVRADLANVEYRHEGLLTGCEHTIKLFDPRAGGDLLADPYLGFGNMATGKIWTRNDPIRQVFKAAVLGLGYLMSFARFIEELLKALADPTFGVSVADLEKVVAEQKWGAPNTAYFKGAVTRTRAPLSVAIVAWHMRELFHRMHPEFERLARWLEHTVGSAYGSLDGAAAIERAYTQANAPDRSLINLQWAGDTYGPGTKSIRVVCGHWYQPTVTWRDLQMRETDYGVQLCCLHQTRGFRPLTKNVMIENCFSGDTPVLTRRGWIPIRYVERKDQLWDGEQWVSHRGAKLRGTKPVGDWNGILVTRDHRLYGAGSWCPVGDLGPGEAAQVVASGRRAWLSFLTHGSVPCGDIATRAWYPGATIRVTKPSETTGAEGSPSAPSGSLIVSRSSGMPEPSPAGMIARWIWTGGTTRLDTSPETSDSYLVPSTAGTGVVLAGSRSRENASISVTSIFGSVHDGGTPRCTIISASDVPEPTSWRDTGHETPVWDIMDSGPNQRFMVLTQQGPVIAHNCVQSAARNAMCEAQLRLRGMGYPYQITVHDELILVVQREREAVLKARADLLTVLGPGNNLGWGWSTLINPAEINVSATLWEQDMDKIEKGWWDKLAAGDASMLEKLT